MNQATERNATYNLEVVIERLDNFKADNAQEHSQILVQTTKTNGKVAEISKIQERLIGGLIVLNIFIVPVVIKIILSWI
jgi:hypothetical protein